MKEAPQNIQDKFLNIIRKENIPVSIIVMNGFQIKNAHIIGFDNFVLLISTENDQTMMLFKHAISSIVPAEPVKLPNFQKEHNE